MRAAWVIVSVGLVALAGCSVRVNKGNNGEDKDVSVNMPFGHVQVHNNDRGAADVGLPAYPGARLDADRDNDKSVDVNVGFGQWKVRVQVANYVSDDPENKVQAYYKTALARYGAVLTCRGDEPVGTPTRTGEGLTCKGDQGHGRGHTYSYSSDADLQLKAGSESRQHVVAFDSKKGPGTHFALIALELPGSGADVSEKGQA